MARYKVVDLSPKFLAVDLEKQLLPGSFAHAVHHLLEHDFDLSGFDTRCRNDEIGACAEGVVSSRGIERLYREHVTFIALGTNGIRFPSRPLREFPLARRTP